MNRIKRTTACFVDVLRREGERERENEKDRKLERKRERMGEGRERAYVKRV